MAGSRNERGEQLRKPEYGLTLTVTPTEDGGTKTTIVGLLLSPQTFTVGKNKITFDYRNGIEIELTETATTTGETEVSGKIGLKRVHTAATKGPLKDDELQQNVGAAVFKALRPHARPAVPTTETSTPTSRPAAPRRRAASVSA